jgi:hypothetical protein
MKKLKVEKISEYFPLERRKDQEGKRKKKENEKFEKIFQKCVDKIKST